MQVWGLINSGTRWLRDVRGGRRAGAPLPPAPVIHVNAPGSIEAYKGHELIGKLQGGRLSGSRMDPFEFVIKVGIDRRDHRNRLCRWSFY